MRYIHIIHKLKAKHSIYCLSGKISERGRPLIGVIKLSQIMIYWITTHMNNILKFIKQFQKDAWKNKSMLILLSFQHCAQKYLRYFVFVNNTTFTTLSFLPFNYFIVLSFPSLYLSLNRGETQHSSELQVSTPLYRSTLPMFEILIGLTDHNRSIDVTIFRIQHW